MNEWLGQLAALGTAISFAFGSTCFTLAGREVGSALVNRSRLLVAVGFIVVLHWLRFGQPLPLEATAEQWGWLGLSGVIGLVLGDAFLFQAFVLIGPRLSMLVYASNPVLVTALAWLFFGEQLSARHLIGIALALLGIMWVVSERRNGHEIGDSRAYLWGLLFGLGGAFGQALGFITSEKGLGDTFDPLSANLIRVFVATLIIWGITTARGRAGASFRHLGAHPRALRFLTLGAILGPVTGVYLSLVAIQNAPLGIASTLASLTPIFLIPIGYVIFGERITRRAVVGTCAAFVGTALLFIA